jgi:hypothetical protein
MVNVSVAEGNEICHIFPLWMSQWKLATVDYSAARSILKFVLDSISTTAQLEVLHHALETFFELPDASAGAEKKMDALIREAMLLSSHEAKRLLDHLRCSYSLSGEDIAFWRIVNKAFEAAGHV